MFLESCVQYTSGVDYVTSGVFPTIIWHHKCHMNIVLFSGVMVLSLLECIQSGNKESITYMKFYMLMFIMATIGYKTRTEMSVN